MNNTLPRFYALQQRILTPVIYLSCVIWGASGIYLLTQGYWLSIWLNIIFFLCSSLAFPFLLLPATVLAIIMKNIEARRPVLGFLLQPLTIIYILAMFSLWAAISYAVASGIFADQNTLIPLLWAQFSVAAPWSVFATYDRQNMLMISLTHMLQIAAATVTAIGYNMPIHFWSVFWIIFGVIFVLFILQSVYERHFMNRPKNPS